MNKKIFFASTLLLLVPVLLNGFPFVYYDTGFYLYYANHLFANPTLLFRPLTYSAILALTHSSFITVLIQCLILNISIMKTAEKLKLAERFHFWVMLIAVLVTPIALYANFLLPDIFFALQFLAFFNIWCPPPQKSWRIFFYLIFVASSVAHYSNFIISALLLVLILIKKRGRKFIGLAIILFVILPMLHFSLWRSFTFTNSTSFFIFSRLTALGLSNEYLTERCKTDKLRLCKTNDSGFNPWDWSPHSVIGQMGGIEAIRGEMQEVSIAILTEPHLLGKFFVRSLKNVGLQFIGFAKVPENTLEDTALKLSLSEFNSIEYSYFVHQRFSADAKETQNSCIQILSHVYLLAVVTSFLLFLVLKKVQTLY